MEQQEKENDLIFGQLDEIRQIEMEGYEHGVRRARNMLFFIAGFSIFSEIVFAVFITHYISIYVLCIVFLISLLLIMLGFLTKIKPRIALVSGIILYVVFALTSIAFNTIFDGAFGALASLFSGLVIKLIVVIVLIRAIPDARKLQNMMSEQQ